MSDTRDNPKTTLKVALKRTALGVITAYFRKLTNEEPGFTGSVKVNFFKGGISDFTMSKTTKPDRI